MKTNIPLTLQNRNVPRFLVTLSCIGLGSSVLFAQDETTDQEVVELSPFVVDASEDQGYVTTQSLSGSRFSQNLDDIPSNISVITAEMMEDIGAFDVNDALAWSVNAEVSDVGETTTSDATGITDGERRNLNVRIRGIQSTTSRNFFKWSVNSDGFNVGRIDTSRGPNALLFGASSLAGLNNITTKQAFFRNLNKVNASFSSNGGGRIAVDINREVIKDKFALRLNAFYHDQDTWREYGNTKKDGFALAGTWKVTDSLTIRFEGEKGSTDSINPKSAIRDNTNEWDHNTLVVAVADPNTAANRRAANAANNAAGIAAIADNFNPIIDINNLDAGAVSWAGQAISQGNASFLKPFVDAGLSTGTEYVAMGLTEQTTLVTDPADSYLSALLLPDWDYGNLLMAGSVVGEHETYSIYLENKFSDNFFVEVAYNHQDQNRKWHSQDGGPNQIRYDLAQTLPAGYTIDGSSDNPNFLKPYLTALPGVREDYVESDEIRALAIYRMRWSDWAKVDIGGNISYRESESGQYRRALTIIDGTNPDLSAAENKPRFRHYLSDPTDGFTQYRDGQTYTIAGSTLEFINAGTGGGQAHTKDKLVSMMAFSTASWGRKGRLKTTVGLRRDSFDVEAYNDYITDPETKEFIRNDLSDTDSDSILSPSYGAVFQVSKWLSVYGNYSKSFVFGDVRQLSFLGDTIDPPIGQSTEFGVRFRFGRKLSGSINTYDSFQENNAINVNNLVNQVGFVHDALGWDDFGQRGDTQTTASKGIEFRLNGNPTRSWTLRASISLPRRENTESYGYAIDEYLATVPATWLEAAGVDAATAAGIASPDDVALIDTTLPGIDAAAVGVIQTRWNNINNIIENRRVNDGQAATRLSKVNGNILTRYTFRKGPLKGFAAGAGIRYIGKKVLNRTAAGDELISDDYLVYKLFFKYSFKWNDLRWNINLNIDNPFDDLNFEYKTVDATTLDGITYNISAPRSGSLRIGVDF